MQDISFLLFPFRSSFTILGFRNTGFSNKERKWNGFVSSSLFFLLLLRPLLQGEIEKRIWPNLWVININTLSLSYIRHRLCVYLLLFTITTNSLFTSVSNRSIPYDTESSLRSPDSFTTVLDCRTTLDSPLSATHMVYCLQCSVL